MLSSSSLRVASRAPFKAVRGARFASGHGGHKAPAVRTPRHVCSFLPLTLLQHLPYTYDKKGAFGAKLTGFVTLGFGVPFLASEYQL